MIRRICFFGGPSSGKSTMASHVFAALKTSGFNVELSYEYVKDWTFLGNKPAGFDQVYILAKQIRKEDVILRNSNAVVLTDCPVLLTPCYARVYGIKAAHALEEIALEFEKEYPSLSFFLNREGNVFKTDGRFQNEEQSQKIDNMILEMMINNLNHWKKIQFNEQEKAVSICKDYLSQGPAG